MTLIITGFVCFWVGLIAGVVLVVWVDDAWGGGNKPGD